ncbi:MAG: hypothetical protein FJ272_14905, partial [Planctomycetes bacterium]|nr:hypothetical protein [Planctomycetota bacterium]
MYVWIAATCVACVCLAVNGMAQDVNLALATAGTRAVADSVARDRWGRDGWWTRLLNDGQSAAVKGQAVSDAAWASDDHKSPHR